MAPADESSPGLFNRIINSVTRGRERLVQGRTLVWLETVAFIAACLVGIAAWFAVILILLLLLL